MNVTAVRNEITGEWIPINPVEIEDEADGEWIARTWNDNVLDLAWRIQLAEHAQPGCHCPRN